MKPKPKYASAFLIRRNASSLPPSGPSPSELVAARTRTTSQPGGVSRRIRASPSSVSAQFRDVADRSSTSRRGSVNVDPEHVVLAQQSRGRDLELA